MTAQQILEVIDAMSFVNGHDPKLIARVDKHQGQSTDYRVTLEFLPPGALVTHLPSGEGIRLPLSL